MPKPTPNDEELFYNSATVTDPIQETEDSIMPSTKTGMQARKKAMREGRCRGKNYNHYKVVRKDPEAAAAAASESKARRRK